MTVKELISKLQELPQNQQVLIRYQDVSDWVYKMKINSDEVRDVEVWNGCDNDGEDIFERAVVIDVKEGENMLGDE